MELLKRYLYLFRFFFRFVFLFCLHLKCLISFCALRVNAHRRMSLSIPWVANCNWNENENEEQVSKSMWSRIRCSLCWHQLIRFSTDLEYVRYTLNSIAVALVSETQSIHNRKFNLHLQPANIIMNSEMELKCEDDWEKIYLFLLQVFFRFNFNPLSDIRVSISTFFVCLRDCYSSHLRWAFGECRTKEKKSK